MIRIFILFQIKHFLCDFIFQSKFMLNKFKGYPDFIAPLLLHSLVNAVGAFLVAVLFSFKLAILIFLFELMSHFVIDRTKASKELLGRWTPENKLFWWSLGFDQMCHQLVYCFYIALLS